MPRFFTGIKEGCKEIYCQYNNLTKLELPKSCEIVYCYNNYLTELILPKTCILASCYSNQLTKLIIPKTCENIHCWSNKFHPIIESLFNSLDPIKIQLANSMQLANNLQKN
jgi:hypothetical protein